MSSARILFGLTVLAVAGCQSYNPNGYGYPGTYNYPSTNMPPGGTYVPKGGNTVPPVGEYPTRATPGGKSSPTPQYPSGKKPAGAPDPKLVPDYDDPNSPTSKSPRGNPDDEDDFKQPLKRNGKNGTSHLKEMEEDGEPVSAIDSPFEEHEFSPPVPFQPGSRGQVNQVSFNAEEEGEEHAESAAKSEQRPNPYAHDAKHYRWFRGVADYDQDEQAWYVVYNPEPDRNDRYGGTIALADHPQLNVLHPNDVILVEGKIDPQLQDRLGKPKFQIEHVARLTPKKK